MMRPLTTLLALGVPLVLALPSYRSTDGNVSISFQEFAVKQLTKSQIRYHLTKNVDARSISQSLRITADDAVCIAETINGKTQFSRIDARGHVHTYKIGKDKRSTQTTEILSTSATMINHPTEVDLTLGGPVEILNSNASAKRTLRATGSSGTATLVPNRQGTQSEFHNAELRGPVRIEVNVGAADGAPPEKMTATADRLIITGLGRKGEVKLIGHVRFAGNRGSQIGSGSGAWLKARFNDQGDVEEFNTGERP